MITTTTPPTVFFAYRFADSDKDYSEGLTNLLKRNGFDVSTGEILNGNVSDGILDRISAAQSFLCLMTRDALKADGTYAPSPWLLEEKGAASILRKPMVLLVEDGVTGYGGMHGDLFVIHFKPTSFLQAGLKAVDQLESHF